MRRKIISILFVIALLLFILIVAYTGASTINEKKNLSDGTKTSVLESKEIETDSHFTYSFELLCDEDNFYLNVEGNPTTGYQWMLTDLLADGKDLPLESISNYDVYETKTLSKYDVGENDLVGAPSSLMFTISKADLDALMSKEIFLTYKYFRVWEGEDNSIGSFELDFRKEGLDYLCGVIVF